LLAIVLDPILRRPKTENPCRLGVVAFLAFLRSNYPSIGNVDIVMQAVLLRRRRVHLLEVDPRADLLRINDCPGTVHLCFRHSPRLEELVPGCEARWRVLFLVVKSRCPELREPSRVCAIEDDLE